MGRWGDKGMGGWGEINYQPSTNNQQPSTINHQPTTNNYQLSTINYQPSTNNY
ncbi:MAG: hypothetical protein VKN72_14735 [Nostocales cyanobacterium 94392]|nr:hypothetical protein [Nostocales cyanobacterium 94392]